MPFLLPNAKLMPHWLSSGAFFSLFSHSKWQVISKGINTPKCNSYPDEYILMFRIYVHVIAPKKTATRKTKQ